MHARYPANSNDPGFYVARERERERENRKENKNVYFCAEIK